MKAIRSGRLRQRGLGSSRGRTTSYRVECHKQVGPRYKAMPSRLIIRKWCLQAHHRAKRRQVSQRQLCLLGVPYQRAQARYRRNRHSLARGSHSSLDSRRESSLQARQLANYSVSKGTSPNTPILRHRRVRNRKCFYRSSSFASSPWSLGTAPSSHTCDKLPRLTISVGLGQPRAACCNTNSNRQTTGQAAKVVYSHIHQHVPSAKASL